MSRLEDVLAGKPDNYILPFFWQHGEDERTLREYMGAIQESGIGAVCVESRPHPDFCGPKWWEDMDVILDEARKRGMKVWILDDSHFPTGFANGAMENAPEELTHQYIVYRTLEVSGPVRRAEFKVEEYLKDAPLPPWIPAPPAPKRQYSPDTLVKILACRMTTGKKLSDPVDLTDNVGEDGVCRFDLGNGYWKIYVIRLTRKARGRNDYINFLSRKSCRILIDAVYEPHFERYGADFGKTIAGFFSDEPPVGNTEGYMPAGPIGNPSQNLPWSEEAEERLTQIYGSEDWKLYIPYLWADAQNYDSQAGIRSAYMNMASLLVKECFSMQLGTWCEKHGVEYIGHMLEDVDMNSDLGISMGHYFRGLFGQHMSGIDNIGGQVMINAFDAPRHDGADMDEAGFYQYTLGKLGASLGAIDPKKKGRTMCETFGAYGWQSGTKEQKYMLDHFMVRGVNYFVPHAFSPAPFPDPDCPPHFYAHGENPLYRAFGELMRYSNRVCHLISGGTPVVDTAVLYNGESKWAGSSMSNIPAARALTTGQVDFHIIPTDVFRNDNDYPMSFDGKILTVNGVQYPSLVVCGCDYVERPAAQFLMKAAVTGFPIVFADKKPFGVSDGGAAENEALSAALKTFEPVPVTALAAAVRSVLAGSVQAAPVPECERLVTYHYVSDREYWLVLNEDGAEAYDGDLKLKTQQALIWYDPWTNRVSETASRQGKGFTKVNLHLEPLQLMILAGVDERSGEPDLPALLQEYAMNKAAFSSSEDSGKEVSSFMVRHITAPEYLHEKEAALAASVTDTVDAPYTGMQNLYPDFAGYYIYDARIDLQEKRAYHVLIDDVSEAAEVFWNGKSLGMRLQKPFVFEVPAEMVEPENVLKIETATLIERKIHAMGVNPSGMSAARPYLPTGILGKVRVV